MIKLLYFGIISLSIATAEAYKLPSDVSFSQYFDNDRNQTSGIDFNLGTPFYAIISAGASVSKLQFGHDDSGRNSSYYLGVKSNPLRDWVFGSSFSYTDVSDQMKILDPSIMLQRYFNRFDLRLEVGFRTIKTKITPGLGFLLNTKMGETEDENFWWALRTNFEIFKNFDLGLIYRQFQYSTRFGFFNLPLAQTLGYTLDTVNYGATFADYIFSVNGAFYWRRWDFALDYTFVNNEFDESTTASWSPAVGLRWSRTWYFNANFGLTRGVTEGEVDVTGSFVGLGTTYSW